MRIEARLTRKTRDLVRDEAENVVSGRWPEVRAIAREEAWEFEVAGGGERVVRRILEETTLVANPNVHRWRVGADPEPGEGVRLEIRVHDRVDARGAAVLRALRERRGLKEVSAVARSVVWTLSVAGDRAAAERVARALTGEDGRGAGLLANPHSQDVSWRIGEPAREAAS